MMIINITNLLTGKVSIERAASDIRFCHSS